MIHFDTELAEDGSTRDSRRLALAYVYLLGKHLKNVSVVDLPERFLVESYDSKEERFVKADLDGALAAGLTQATVTDRMTTSRPSIQNMHFSTGVHIPRHRTIIEATRTE